MPGSVGVSPKRWIVGFQISLRQNNETDKLVLNFFCFPVEKQAIIDTDCGRRREVSYVP